MLTEPQVQQYQAGIKKQAWLPTTKRPSRLKEAQLKTNSIIKIHMIIPIKWKSRHFHKTSQLMLKHRVPKAFQTLKFSRRKIHPAKISRQEVVIAKSALLASKKKFRKQSKSSTNWSRKTSPRTMMKKKSYGLLKLNSNRCLRSRKKSLRTTISDLCLPARIKISLPQLR